MPEAGTSAVVEKQPVAAGASALLIHGAPSAEGSPPAATAKRGSTIECPAASPSDWHPSKKAKVFASVAPAIEVRALPLTTTTVVLGSGTRNGRSSSPHSQTTVMQVAPPAYTAVARQAPAPVEGMRFAERLDWVEERERALEDDKASSQILSRLYQVVIKSARELDRFQRENVGAR